MTISTTASQTTLFGNNATTSFAFSFITVSTAFIQVIYTDANGNQTTLTPSQYTITLNAPASGQIWGIGGVVNYSIAGSPIPAGSSITIKRVLPLTQTTSISNQGNFYPQAVEAALDILCLELQQISARNLGQSRGIWTTATTYAAGDYIIDGVNGNNTNSIYVCSISNTSGVWATDLANGLWALSVNFTPFISAQNAAAASAAAAAGSATSASNSAAAVLAVAASYTANPIVREYVVAPGNTSFNLAATVGSGNNVALFFDGVYQPPSSYTLSGQILTPSVMPPTGTNVVARLGNAPLPATQVTDNSVTFTSLANGLIATSAQAIAGALDNVLMTPLKNAAAFASNIAAWASGSTFRGRRRVLRIDATNQPSVSFGSFILGRNYTIKANGTFCLAGGDTVMRLSTDNGATFKSGASDYSYCYLYGASASAQSAQAVTSYLSLTFGGSATAAQAHGYEVTLNDPMNPAISTRYYGNGGGQNNSNYFTFSYSGVRGLAEANNAIQIIPVSGGNFGGGYFELWEDLP